MSVLNCLYSMLYVYRPIIFTKDGKVFLFNGSRYPIMSGYLPCRGPMSERCRIRESMQRSNSTKVSVSFSCRPGEPLRMPATNKSITINPIISINTGTGTDKKYGQQFGLIALGLFKDETEIANSPSQFGTSYLKPGDIKYKDINGDGVIDDADEVPIGYSDVPEIVWYGE